MQKRAFSEDDMSDFERAAFTMLNVLDNNPSREGLKETPKRFAKMMAEMFEGTRYSNQEIAAMFDKCFEDVETGDLVVVQDIPIFSFCEHHIALMYDMKVHIGYIPKNKVIGLSKLARIADMAAKRLQLQERIGNDIAEIVSMVVDTEDVIVVIEGKHSCMTARGVKKDSTTRTSALRGLFKNDSDLRSEFFNMIK